MSGESLSISLLLRHNLPVNRKALGDSLSFVKESARSVLDLSDPPPLPLPRVSLLSPTAAAAGAGVWGAESQEEEFVVALFSRVAEFSGGSAALAFMSVFCSIRTLIRTVDRRCSFSSERSAAVGVGGGTGLGGRGCRQWSGVAVDSPT